MRNTNRDTLESALDFSATIAIYCLAVSTICPKTAQFDFSVQIAWIFIYRLIQSIKTSMVKKQILWVMVIEFLKLILFMVLGAHFGSTFPHLFLHTFPDIVKKIEPVTYTAKLFGFRIHHSSLPGPRIQWLRMKQPKIKDDDAEMEDEEDTTIL